MERQREEKVVKGHGEGKRYKTQYSPLVSFFAFSGFPIPLPPHRLPQCLSAPPPHPPWPPCTSVSAPQIPLPPPRPSCPSFFSFLPHLSLPPFPPPPTHTHTHPLNTHLSSGCSVPDTVLKTEGGHSWGTRDGGSQTGTCGRPATLSPSLTSLSNAPSVTSCRSSL